jgi:hypothetical protein
MMTNLLLFPVEVLAGSNRVHWRADLICPFFPNNRVIAYGETRDQAIARAFLSLLTLNDGKYRLIEELREQGSGVVRGSQPEGGVA